MEIHGNLEYIKDTCATKLKTLKLLHIRLLLQTIRKDGHGMAEALSCELIVEELAAYPRNVLGEDMVTMKTSAKSSFAQ